MSARGCGRAGLLALALFTRAAHAQVDADVQPNVNSVGKAAVRVQTARCDRPACQAIVLIDRAVQLQLTGAEATVGRPRPIHVDRGAHASAASSKLVRQSRRLTPALCQQAATLLSSYSAPGVVSEVIVPVAVLDLTSRLDANGATAGCTRTVIRGMPASSATDVAIHNARALCTTQGGAGPCADIFR